MRQKEVEKTRSSEARFGRKVKNLFVMCSHLPAFPASEFLVYVITAMCLLQTGCSEKANLVDVSKLPQSTGQVVSDTNYIQIQPEWGGFNSPANIKIGFDYILYVTEPNSDRIVMMDLAGTNLGHSQYVKRPVAVAEDRRFNLIIACEYDTTVNGSVVTVAAIAKIRLFNYNHDISAAPVEIVYHESLQQQITRDGARNLISGREYTGVAVLPDNSYYVTRSGNNNSSPVDPDNKILHFDKNDNEYSSDYIDLVPSLVPTGTGFVAINQISGITTFNTRQYGTDFILTQIDPANAFKVKWVHFNPGSELFAPSWDSKLSLTTTPLPDLLSSVFVSPRAVMVDDRSNIYIIDSSLDSLMKFDLTGKLLHESFGPSKSSLLHPSGITYFNKIVYISDTGHNRILRYELSTDLK